MIHINIWDDYFEDGYVPEGEIQETYAYLERSEGVEDDEVSDCLEHVMFLIKKMQLLPSCVQMDIDFYDARVKTPELAKCLTKKQLTRWEIRFSGLSHALRLQLVTALAQQRLFYKGEPIVIYSES